MDFNAKVGYQLGERDRILLSGYYGKDHFSLQDNYVNRFSNGVFNVRWNHLFSDRLFANLSAIYSRYFSTLELDFEGSIWDSYIDSYNFKYDLNHYLNNNLQINYGSELIYYQFNPGTVAPNSPESGIVPEQLTLKYALQSALYADVEQKIGGAIPGQLWD